MRVALHPLVVAAVLIVGLCLAGGPAPAQDSGLVTEFERDSLVIETAGGERLEFAVELAQSRQEQAQGLMFRRTLGRNEGMLFLYGADQIISMWMKNTLIPLDMLFIESDGRIAKVVQRTVPLSTRTISSDRPVRGVLELNGGSAARFGITPGDRVEHPAFNEAH